MRFLPENAPGCAKGSCLLARRVAGYFQYPPPVQRHAACTSSPIVSLKPSEPRHPSVLARIHSPRQSPVRFQNFPRMGHTCGTWFGMEFRGTGGAATPEDLATRKIHSKTLWNNIPWCRRTPNGTANRSHRPGAWQCMRFEHEHVTDADQSSALG